MTTLLRQNGFEVEVLADSVVVVPKELHTPGYHRLTSFRLRYPRIVHAELMTHRELSRNSASSRAVPTPRLLSSVRDFPFSPIKFPRTHTGMVASDWVDSTMHEFEDWKSAWLSLKDTVISGVQRLVDLGMSKQIANRPLEAFQWYQALVSATEWENFVALRAHHAAQFELQYLADMILNALNSSTPRVLTATEWHLPFGDKLDDARLIAFRDQLESKGTSVTLEELRRIIVIARCARVSYNNFDGSDDYQKDWMLYRQLLSDVHMSPFEHVARPMDIDEYQTYRLVTPTHIDYGRCGNFRGFIQARKLLPYDVERRSEPRIRPLTFE